jgi:heme/copper-type cytochrome/quinol oxidase subunit 3
MLTILLAITFFSRGEEPDTLGADVVSMYWHFVDGFWAVIFPVVYLWRFA